MTVRAEQAAGGRIDQRGFTLMVSLFVLVLLTSLGLTLMFTTETERSISRNFSGQIQASYAAEASARAMVEALMFDLNWDKAAGWRNRYLVVCELTTGGACNTKYGFNPTSNPDCSTSNNCVIQDTTGNLTGRKDQFALDLMWRPSGVAAPTFPSQMPVRLHPKMKGALHWWNNLANRLGTGDADIALTSICTSNCTNPAPADYASKEVLIHGLGKSVILTRARLIRKTNPATRAISIRLKGTNVGVWGNALVGGQGAGSLPVIQGDYLIRGGTLQFNTNQDATVLKFDSADTGIVNNWYDTDSVPKISNWWWLDARPCNSGVSHCDPTHANTVEAIVRHLPNPDQGGYKAGNTDFPGPEGLNSIVRIKKGKIEININTAGIGRTETDEGSVGGVGRYYDNVMDIFTGDSSSMSDIVDPQPPMSVFRRYGSTANLADKTGPFDLSATTIKFPSLNDVYDEPVTRVQYANYYDFLRPASGSGNPGGWALDLSGIDGTTGIGRTVTFGDGSAAQNCWPRFDAGGGANGGFTSPTLSQLQNTFGTGPVAPNGYTTLYGCDARYYLSSTTCASATLGKCDDSPPATSCTVTLKCDDDIFAPNFFKCGNVSFPQCPATSPVTLFRRYGHFPAADATLNLDTSSSLDAPRGRQHETMFNSFAYKLLVDVVKAIDTGANGDPEQSTLYLNNLKFLPDIFKVDIPGTSVYPTACSTNDHKSCFQERRAYMDVHIQLPDVPTRYGDRKSATAPGFNVDNDADGTNDNLEEGYMPVYPDDARWLSVRFHPPPSGSTTGGTMTLLSDPRAKINPCGDFTASTDIADEVMEPVTVGNPQRTRRFLLGNEKLPATEQPRVSANQTWGCPVRGAIVPQFNNCPYQGPAGGGTWATLAIPAGYDRAKPRDPADITFRNMPTGAFVIALHLPCSKTLTDKNPYKCSQSDVGGYVPPAIAYDGMYTHFIAWAPKYTCWRSHRNWIAADQVPHPKTDAGNVGIEKPTGSCNCPKTPPTRPDKLAWFVESMWQVNGTTLKNERHPAPNGPRNFASALQDKSEPFSLFFGEAMTGFSIYVPYNNGDLGGVSDVVDGVKDAGTLRSCRYGLDRFQNITNAERCTGGVNPRFTVCGVDGDGLACNGNLCAGQATACATAPAANCATEPDFVPGSTNPYGGCNEMYTPLVKKRVSQLDPMLAPFNNNPLTLPIACGTMFCGPTNLNNECVQYGIDPDTLGSWTGVDRYSRVWPGWSSASFLEVAGLILTRDGVRFGSPQVGGNSCYNCAAALDYPGAPPGHNAAHGNQTNQNRGYYSDPIVYDGRAILFAGTSTTSTSAVARFHDHVVPRGTMGCGDFLSVLANGNTEVDMQMPFDTGQTKEHLIALYSLSQNKLLVTTSDSAVSTQLAGSWLAEGANFGTPSTPVQLIGTPSISSGQCDHIGLPGRDPISLAEIVSFVEDEMLPQGY